MYRMPAAPGRYNVRPMQPMYGWRRGFGPGAQQRMRPTRSEQGFGPAINNIPNLTEKQKNDIAELRTKQQQEMQKLRDESANKMQLMRDAHRKKMLDLLTDEQKKYVESRQER